VLAGTMQVVIFAGGESAERYEAEWTVPSGGTLDVGLIEL